MAKQSRGPCVDRPEVSRQKRVHWPTGIIQRLMGAVDVSCLSTASSRARSNGGVNLVNAVGQRASLAMQRDHRTCMWVVLDMLPYDRDSVRLGNV